MGFSGEKATEREMLECPHCLGDVPMSALVCRGCKAEIKYGVPGWAYAMLVILCLVVAFQVQGIFSWPIIIGIFILGRMGLKTMFAERVVFIRQYRH